MYSILPFLFLIGVYQYDAVSLRVYRGKVNSFVIVPLDKPRHALQYVNKSLITVFYTFGLNGTAVSPTVFQTVKSLLDEHIFNVILLDWTQEAMVGFFGIEIAYNLIGMPTVETIGSQFGSALVQLFKCEGLDPTKVYLVGHCLGAHFMGQAGRRVAQNGYVVPRITGLNPSGPMFEKLVNLPRLDKTCALFVDIVHTDWIDYGVNASIGHVDIFVNYNIGYIRQPGCPKENYDVFSPEALCSHNRAVFLFDEAIKRPLNLPALGAPYFDAWVKLNGQGDNFTFIGPTTNLENRNWQWAGHIARRNDGRWGERFWTGGFFASNVSRARGNFFCVTNKKPPFGKGTAGLKPDAVPVPQTQPSKQYLGADASIIP